MCRSIMQMSHSCLPLVNRVDMGRPTVEWTMLNCNAYSSNLLQICWIFPKAMRPCKSEFQYQNNGGLINPYLPRSGFSCPFFSPMCHSNNVASVGTGPFSQSGCLHRPDRHHKNYIMRNSTHHSFSFLTEWMYSITTLFGAYAYRWKTAILEIIENCRCTVAQCVVRWAPMQQCTWWLVRAPCSS